MRIKPKLMMKPSTLTMICRQLKIPMNKLLSPNINLYQMNKTQAVKEFKKGNITEGQLSKILKVNRIKARQIVQEYQSQKLKVKSQKSRIQK